MQRIHPASGLDPGGPVAGACDALPADTTARWWTTASLALVTAAVVAMSLGCSPRPDAQAGAIGDRAHAVQPDSIRVDAGIMVADLIRMKVNERVDEPSGRVTSPARLSGRLFLENVSADQPVRLIGGRIVYLDSLDQVIPLESGRAEPTIRFAPSHGAPGQLDPGKVATELVYAEFPTAALAVDRLKTIQIHLTYASAPGGTEEKTLRFPVSIVALPAPRP